MVAVLRSLQWPQPLLLLLFTGHGLPASILPLLAAPLAVVGLLDDRHGLPASRRYCVQLFTAVLILGFSPLVTRTVLAVAAGNWLLLVALPLLLIAVTAVINFTNFMDGLDGLVGGCMAVVITALTLSLNAPGPSGPGGLSTWLLIWNWSPAKVFMGDVGSTFLGAMFVGLLLQASSWLEAFGYLLVCTPCWQTLVFAFSVDCSLASLCSTLTDFTCFNDCTMQVGPTLACRSCISLQQLCWRSQCSRGACLGFSPLLLLSFCLGLGWTSVSRCPSLWPPTTDRVFLFEEGQ